MARITENYDSHTKDELLSEAHLRNLDGINTGTLKADIVAALELSDEAATDAAKTPAPPQDLSPAAISAPKPPGEVPANIPTIAVPKAETVRYLGQPPTNDKYAGVYIERKTREPFALAILPSTEVENNRTHFLKNNVHFHNVTADEFQLNFEKQ